MDLTDRLKAWGAAHAEARRAEDAVQQGGEAAAPGELRAQAKSLRERADRLHREIYLSLDRRGRDKPR